MPGPTVSAVAPEIEQKARHRLPAADGGAVKRRQSPLSNAPRRCAGRKLEMITVKHVGKPYICRIVCLSPRCKRKIVYDVSGGFPQRRKN